MYCRDSSVKIYKLKKLEELICECDDYQDDEIIILEDGKDSNFLSSMFTKLKVYRIKY